MTEVIKMRKKKYFFFDIDGTLAIHGVIPEGNLKALKLLQDQGHLTFICTGRAPFYAQNLFWKSCQWSDYM